MDQKEKERIKNALTYKVYATDKEIEELNPFFAILGLLAAVVIVGFWVFGSK